MPILYSDLSPDDLGAAEGAMLMLLDDPSPLVRRALADVLAASPDAPPAIIFALAADQPSIAAPVLALSPLFVDADLVDAVATGGAMVQAAVASRAALPRSVAAAIAEVGTAEASLVLVENHDADIAPLSIDRIVERFGHLAAIREPLLMRDDLAVATRQTLVAKLSQTLAGFVAGRAWLDPDHAQRIAREACEKATVAIAADSATSEVRPLIRHLRVTGQLTAGLILRALLSGNVVLFEEALAELADMPVARVSGLIHDRGNAGLRALFDQGGAAVFDLSGLQGSDRGDARRRLCRRAGRRRAAQAAHDRARADALRGRGSRRARAVAHAAAPLRHRSRARGSASVLRRARGGHRRSRRLSGRGLGRSPLIAATARIHHYMVGMDLGPRFRRDARQDQAPGTSGGAKMFSR